MALAEDITINDLIDEREGKIKEIPKLLWPGNPNESQLCGELI